LLVLLPCYSPDQEIWGCCSFRRRTEAQIELGATLEEIKILGQIVVLLLDVKF
jgi:hypothetical protein